MKKLGVVTAALLAAGLVASNSAQAITYGTPDCDDDGVTNCGNPNVVLLATYRRDGRSGMACSGTLVDHVSGYYLFLTAGHCTSQWTGFIAQGFAVSVGVSFDGKVEKVVKPSGIGFDLARFAPGGVPVTDADVKSRGVNDYGIVSVPEAAVHAKWPDANGIDFVMLPEEANLSLDALVASTTKPQKNLKFYAVGYGMTEPLDFGSNAGGPTANGTGSGVRRVADMQGFDNLRKAQLQTSQNPALGNNGSCYGDSGGPAFYATTSGPVQVGLTSWGDTMCRAVGDYSRTDIDSFRTFIDCARANPGNVKLCGN
jgi:hypothetical protein